MPLRISSEVLAQVAEVDDWLRYREVLYRIDYARFRGLGERHNKRFVQHATSTADELRLLYTTDVAYLMFLMSYLGSHFLVDPRYRALAAVFQESCPTGIDTRTERARTLFIRAAEQMLGPDLRDRHRALSRVMEQMDHLMEPSTSVTDVYDFLAGLYSFEDEEEAVFDPLPRSFLDSAGAAAG
ncbi:MAG: hypothetical protein AAGA56_29045, partial [Myxococcota bacterium]